MPAALLMSGSAHCDLVLAVVRSGSAHCELLLRSGSAHCDLALAGEVRECPLRSAVEDCDHARAVEVEPIAAIWSWQLRCGSQENEARREEEV